MAYLNSKGLLALLVREGLLSARQRDFILVNGERVGIYRSEIVGTGDAWQLNGTIYLEGCKLVGSRVMLICCQA